MPRQPKDEEPYGRLNPKTTKWLHRQFRWIIPFGRSCLIPNLSYISEAAASLMDTRLELNIVPKTELVSISSPSFFYDWIDRVAYKQNRKPLPDKIGSFQFFLHGYTDASTFLREHPWPGRSIADTFDEETHRTGMAASKRVMSALNLVCGRTGEEEDGDDDLEAGFYGQGLDEERARTQSDSQDFYWSLALQNDFRLELEKLIILDYIIRNTDRGADNYMIKYCNQAHDKPIVDQAPTRGATPTYSAILGMSNGRPDSVPAPLLIPAQEAQPLSPSASTTDKAYSRPHMHIAAIDNSLSFPHEHPKGWRSFTYGWLYLPVSLIGRPFSEQTRRHFLPLLSSKAWWEETTHELRKLFAIDPDFHPKMFARQMAVIKGQAWNVLQSLKHPDEGPLELTRRVKVLIWDDEIQVGESFSADAVLGPLSAGAVPSTFAPFPRSSPTRPRRIRSVSTPRAESHFPPAPPTAIFSRTSSDFTGSSRPVPFAGRVSTRVNPAATGVSVLEHMERLDRVEQGLKRLGRTEDEDDGDEEEHEVLFEEEEEHEGTPLMKEPSPPRSLQPSNATPSQSSTLASTSATDQAHENTDPAVNGGKPRLSGLGDASARPSVRMSEDGANKPKHVRWASHGAHEGRSGRSMDVSRTPLPMDGMGVGTKTVIAERVETVEAKAFFSCW
ncbi:hypothetical protein M408DRAFT_320207 [Serendipita vermifera MAFF 305830]|uniref:Phosphatidylinositol 4-kinase n=1 Tax=Serendipita vermifera MAFF 305830 TaxID=933852 RepID=A0A0C3BIC7_SERVB|nr:hypothetical protein M408DRAFT_320207 [Serendipita vermifera MAFF 305830]